MAFVFFFFCLSHMVYKNFSWNTCIELSQQKKVHVYIHMMRVPWVYIILINIQISTGGYTCAAEEFRAVCVSGLILRLCVSSWLTREYKSAFIYINGLRRAWLYGIRCLYIYASNTSCSLSRSSSFSSRRFWIIDISKNDAAAAATDASVYWFALFAVRWIFQPQLYIYILHTDGIETSLYDVIEPYKFTATTKWKKKNRKIPNHKSPQASPH